MQFQEIQLVRVSVFPVDGCRDRIASYAFQDEGNGQLTLIPKFNFGGRQPPTRTIALDALQGLFGILTSSYDACHQARRGEPPLKAQLDLRLTIAAGIEVQTVPVQIRYGERTDKALVPYSKISDEAVGPGCLATICWKPCSSGVDDAGTDGSDAGTNEAGRLIREAFRRVRGIESLSQSWALTTDFAFPKLIRIKSSSGAGGTRNQLGQGYNAVIESSSIGAGGYGLLNDILRAIVYHEGEVGLRQLEHRLNTSGIFPEASGRTFDFREASLGVRQDGEFLHTMDQLGSYELPTLKIMALLYTYASRNSIVILDGLDRVLDDTGQQRVIDFIRRLSGTSDIKVIISDRGASWTYRARGHADLPNAAANPLYSAAPKEMHPRNLPQKLTIYVEGKYDKFVYGTMLGENLMRRINLINPHEDDDYVEISSHTGNINKGKKSSSTHVDGSQAVIDAVKYRCAIHGDLGKFAYIGFCDGDVACTFGELRSLLSAAPRLFTLPHRDSGENIYFAPYHSIENVMIVDGKALEYIQLSRRTHARRDLAPGALAISVDLKATIGCGKGDDRAEPQSITDQEIDFCFRQALDKYRRIQGPGKIGHLPKKKRDQIANTWKMASIDMENADYSNRKIYEEYGLDSREFVEGRGHRHHFKLRLCDGDALLGLAKKKIKQPNQWEQGLVPLLASSPFAASLRNTVKSRLDLLDMRLQT